GPSTSYRCRSEPQIAVEVTSTIASVGSSMRGSGTSCTRTSRLPCQVAAFIADVLSPRTLDFSSRRLRLPAITRSEHTGAGASERRRRHRHNSMTGASAFRLLHHREVQLSLIVLLDVEDLVVEERRRLGLQEDPGTALGSQHLVAVLRPRGDRKRELRSLFRLLPDREPQTGGAVLTVLGGQRTDRLHGSVSHRKHGRYFPSVA